MGGWQPIETAPKDGTEVLLWVPDIGARPAFWERGRWESPVDCTVYDDTTHWMPLPEPPVPA